MQLHKGNTWMLKTRARHWQYHFLQFCRQPTWPRIFLAKQPLGISQKFPATVLETHLADQIGGRCESE